LTRAQEFEELRPLLFSIAYRIIGSVTEAEDAVQETWLRYQESPTTPDSAKAFLSTVVTRISIDVLRSARVRREAYVGEWFPEPLLADPYEDPQRSAELADSVSMAALLLLERLSPLERAVFVLREVFGFGFAEIASAVGRSEAACRQLGARARRHMDDGRPRFEADRREREKLAARFFDALRDGDVDRLQGLLAADVHMIGDGGGKAPQWARGIFGAENVARVLAAIVPPFARIGGALEVREVNGQPGALIRDRDGRVFSAMTVQTIRSVINPDKLGHVGPVADAWAVVREVNQERRLTDLSPWSSRTGRTGDPPDRAAPASATDAAARRRGGRPAAPPPPRPRPDRRPRDRGAAASGSRHRARSAAGSRVPAAPRAG
jgi:RNA polymerase sigma-70 factor (ECF subfamily)